MQVEPPVIDATWHEEVTYDWLTDPAGESILIHEGGTRSGKTYNICLAWPWYLAERRGVLLSIVRATGPRPQGHRPPRHDRGAPRRGRLQRRRPQQDRRRRHAPAIRPADRVLRHRGQAEGPRPEARPPLVQRGQRGGPGDVPTSSTSARPAGSSSTSTRPCGRTTGSGRATTATPTSAASVRRTRSNPFLTAKQIGKIEALREQDDWKWQVYGLGQRGVPADVRLPRRAAAPRVARGARLRLRARLRLQRPDVAARVARRDRRGPRRPLRLGSSSTSRTSRRGTSSPVSRTAASSPTSRSTATRRARPGRGDPPRRLQRAGRRARGRAPSRRHRLPQAPPDPRGRRRR